MEFSHRRKGVILHDPGFTHCYGSRFFQSHPLKFTLPPHHTIPSILKVITIMQADSINSQPENTISRMLDCVYCNITNARAMNRENAMDSLPVFFYFLIVAVVAIGAVAFLIVASRQSIMYDEEELPVGGDDDNASDEAAIWIDNATKSVIRAKVVSEIFTTKIVKDTDLYHDPEANTVEWVEGSCNKDATCSICIDHFAEGDVVATSRCSHVFHRDCIMGWSQIKSECPVCRQGMWEATAFDKLEQDVVEQLLQGPVCTTPQDNSKIDV